MFSCKDSKAIENTIKGFSSWACDQFPEILQIS